MNNTDALAVIDRWHNGDPSAANIIVAELKRRIAAPVVSDDFRQRDLDAIARYTHPPEVPTCPTCEQPALTEDFTYSEQHSFGLVTGLRATRCTSCKQDVVQSKDQQHNDQAYADRRAAPVVAEWLPIESAPMDGTAVYFYHPGYKNAFYDADHKPQKWVDWWTTLGWWRSAPSAPATHWMPLPAAPSPEAP